MRSLLKKTGKYCGIEFDSFRGKNKLYSRETLDFSQLKSFFKGHVLVSSQSRVVGLFFRLNSGTRLKIQTDFLSVTSNVTLSDTEIETKE